MENISKDAAHTDKYITRELCQQRDLEDPLQHYRGEFLVHEDSVYMDGNSLGPLPKRVIRRVENTTREQWGLDLIQSWNKHQWIDLPLRVGEKIARLVGAQPDQVICCDSVSINLFKLLAAAMQLQPDRHVILSQRDNFPTDLYMAQGLAALVGRERCELKLVESEDIPNALDDKVAVLLLTEVNFRNGLRHDMKAITALAQRHGALIIWDLSHSTGAFPVALDQCHADFAVGCGYKYLNGGPGAPAFMYVAKRHQPHLQQPLCGWMGHRNPFAFQPDYQASEGINQCLSGTPSILSMAALDEALDIFSALNLSDVYAKSVAMSDMFIQLVRARDELAQLELISPIDPHQRGSQLAYTHKFAFAICQALIDHKIIVDFREPNIIRFGFTPLYQRFIDIFVAVEKLAMIVRSKTYMKDKYHIRNKVT